MCDATAEKLQALWTQITSRAPAPRSTFTPFLEAKTRSIIEDKLYKSLRLAKRGSGAGLSGWRFEFLFPLLRSDAWGPFVDLAARIATGDAPEGVFAVLRQGRATALNKKKAGEVRPLVCHEPLRRLITRALVAESTQDIAGYLGPCQFAVGVPGGCPALAKCVQKVAEEHPEMVFFKLDLANAYNSQRRSDALENLDRAAPELCSFLRLFYGHPSQYVYRTSKDSHRILIAREGVEQGDVAGPALFAAGLKTPLDRLRTALCNLDEPADDDTGSSNLGLFGM